jgi:hypothetical protein
MDQQMHNDFDGLAKLVDKQAEEIRDLQHAIQLNAKSRLLQDEQIRLLQQVIIEAEIGTFEGYDIALSAAKKAGAYATEDAQRQGGESNG